MDKVRLLHVIGGGEIGGAERHVLTLIEKLDPAVFAPAVLCLCRGPFAALLRERGIPVWEIPMASRLDITKIGPVTRLLRQEGINLVHTHGVRANLVARTAAHREGLPVVTTFHSILRYDYASRYAAGLARLLTRATNGYTTVFVAVSGSIREDLINMGISPARIRVIYNGIDADRLRPRVSPGEVRSRYGVPQDALVVGMVARLQEVKGHACLLAAAPGLLRDYPGLYFLLVGDGPLRPEIEERIRAGGMEGRVILAGYSADVENIYPALDICCLPSLMEGLPLTLLEAMYLGVPVVASRVGGIPEVVRDGVDGLLVAPKDSEELGQALGRLLGDENLRARLSQEGRTRAAEFTLARMVRSVADIYLELLAK